MTEGNHAHFSLVNDFCRKKAVKFMAASVDGVFARCFNDFGDSFEVLDKNGEDTPELIIKEISQSGVVTLISKHNLEDGDSVLIYQVQGMQKLEI